MTTSRVLLLSYFNPLEETSGAGFRSSSLLKNLCELGCRVDLFTFTDSSSREGWAAPPEKARTLVLKRGKNSALLAMLRALCFQAPLAVALHETPESVRSFKEFTAGTTYDVVIFDNLFVYNYKKYLGNFSGRSVLNEHNAEYKMSEESHKIHTTILKKITTYINTRNIRRFELAACQEVDRVIHTSDTDLMCFPATRDKSVVVPNTLPYRQPSKLARMQDDNVLFVGSMSHYPNVEGIVRFIEEAWGSIHSRRNSAQLLIVGKNPPPSISMHHGRSNIHVLGFVSDLQPLYEQCKIAITPINFGSGTRLKIVEAMMHSTLNIASEKGAEGLLVEDGKNIVLAKSNEDWVASVLHYLERDEEREAIAKNGYETAVTTYYYQTYRDLISKVIGLDEAAG